MKRSGGALRVVCLVAAGALAGVVIAFAWSSSLPRLYVARASLALHAAAGAAASPPAANAPLLAGRVASALGLPRARVAAALELSSSGAQGFYGLGSYSEPATVEFRASWPSAAGALAIAASARAVYGRMLGSGRRGTADAATVAQRSPRVGRDVGLGCAALALLSFLLVTRGRGAPRVSRPAAGLFQFLARR